MPPKKQIRPNKGQIIFLVDYMRQHPDFGAGKFTGAMGQAKMQKEWENLKDLLNEHGPVRTVEQWKVTWRDQKVKARKEGGAHHRALNQTGNGPVPELSEISTMVLDTIGTEMAVGIGPAESSIGFSSPVVQAPPAIPVEIQLHKVEAPMQPPLPKRRKKALLPPERFLQAQNDLNKTIENHLQLLNGTLVSINTTLQLLQQELVEANRLRNLQIQGHEIVQQFVIEGQENAEVPE